jgi:hypothetical protein
MSRMTRGNLQELHRPLGDLFCLQGVCFNGNIARRKLCVGVGKNFAEKPASLRQNQL